MVNRGEKQMLDRLHEMMRELAQEIASDVAKILKADKSEVLAPIAPVVLPRLTPSSPKYLTQRDIARLFNVSSRTIYNWRTQGEMPAVRMLPNGREVWREDEIEMWVATGVETKKG